MVAASDDAACLWDALFGEFSRIGITAKGLGFRVLGSVVLGAVLQSCFTGFLWLCFVERVLVSTDPTAQGRDERQESSELRILEDSLGFKA